MKKLLFFVLIIILHASNFAYGQKVNQIIKKERGVLYVVDRGWDYVVNTNVITVKLISHNSVIDPTLKVLNIDPSGYIDIQVPQGKDIQEFVEELKQSKQFESVEYNTYGTLCMTPNDRYYSQQSYLDTINAPSAWDITTGNPNIKVAVIDTGIEVAHSDIGYGSNTYSNVSLTEGVNYTNESNTHISPVNSHGTQIAGIIGAKTNNSMGIAGICGGNNSSGVTMIPYCVTNDDDISNIDVRSAIYNAIDSVGVKIINMSLHLSEDNATNACLDYAYNHNVCIVCSAGNNENSGTSGIYYPASYSKTIAVGAKDSTNARWIKSQYGQGLDLVAPGVTIKTTDINNSYTNLYSGTSLSAPQVSGAIALLLSINPSLTPDQIKSILHNSCTKLSSYSYNSSGWNEEVGYGLLNVNEALISLFSIIGPTTIYDSSEYSISNLPNTLNVNWSLNGTNASCCTLQINTPSVNQYTITLKDSVDFVNANDLVLNAQIRHGYPVITTLTMPLTPVYILGSTIPYSTSSYEIGNLPDDCIVSWNWSGTGLTIDNTPVLVEPYYSTNNYFKLVRNNLDYARGTLTATINRSGNTVATISKTLDTGVNFSGTWYQGLNSPSTLTCGNTYAISGSQVVLQSDNFIGRTMTYSCNGMLLFGGVSHSGNTISFTPVVLAFKGDEPNGYPGFSNSITITVTDATTHEAFKFTFYIEPQHPLNPPILSMAVSGNEYTFTIDEASESRQAWTLEVVKIDTGQQVYSCTTDNASQTVRTSNWQSGIYAALVRRNGQIVATQKMTIK